jgi:hypothetical protein
MAESKSTLPDMLAKVYQDMVAFVPQLKDQTGYYDLETQQLVYRRSGRNATSRREKALEYLLNLVKLTIKNSADQTSVSYDTGRIQVFECSAPRAALIAGALDPGCQLIGDDTMDDSEMAEARAYWKTKKALVKYTKTTISAWAETNFEDSKDITNDKAFDKFIVTLRSKLRDALRSKCVTPTMMEIEDRSRVGVVDAIPMGPLSTADTSGANASSSKGDSMGDDGNPEDVALNETSQNGGTEDDNGEQTKTSKHT